MENFWDYKVWGTVNLVAVLLLSLLAANILKRKIPFLEKSLIPTSVLGGTILLIIAGFYDLVAKTPMFETKFFAENGYNTLETITYHTLALGLIASTFKSTKGKLRYSKMSTNTTTIRSSAKSAAEWKVRITPAARHMAASTGKIRRLDGTNTIAGTTKAKAITK